MCRLIQLHLVPPIVTRQHRDAYVWLLVIHICATESNQRSYQIDDQHRFFVSLWRRRPVALGPAVKLLSIVASIGGDAHGSCYT